VFNLDPAKLLIIAVVAVLLLGPDKLPQVARQVGAAWRSVNEFRHRMESEVRTSMPDLPSSADIARLARSPSALLNHLSNMASDDTDGTDGTPTSDNPPGSESPVPDAHISPVTGLPVEPPSTSVPPPTSVPPSPIMPPTSTSTNGTPASTNGIPSVPPAGRRSDAGSGAGAGTGGGAGDPSLN
jgi:sec-independent protein translocase protein TatB